jgi:hypothetical protein
MTEITNQNTSIAEIEGLLISHFRPYFFSRVSLPEESPPRYQFLICSYRFENMSVNDRISYVFNLINSTNAGILDDNVIIVEAFTASEFEDLIEYTEI